MIAIEIQMQARMKVPLPQRCVAFFWRKAEMVSPLGCTPFLMTFRVRIIQRTKRASIRLAPKLLKPKDLNIFDRFAKKDDVADVDDACGTLLGLQVSRRDVSVLKSQSLFFLFSFSPVTDLINIRLNLGK